MTHRGQFVRLCFGLAGIVAAFLFWDATTWPATVCLALTLFVLLWAALIGAFVAALLDVFLPSRRRQWWREDAREWSGRDR